MSVTRIATVPPVAESAATGKVAALFDDIKQLKVSIFNEVRKFADANRIRTYLEVDFIQICEDIIKNLSAR